jgi:hypothetical protein
MSCRSCESKKGNYVAAIGPRGPVVVGAYEPASGALDLMKDNAVVVGAVAGLAVWYLFLRKKRGRR